MAQSNATQKRKSQSRSMAGSRSQSRSTKRPANRTNTSAKSSNVKRQVRQSSRTSGRRKKPNPFADEIVLIVTVVVSILLILSSLNLGGSLSDAINGVTFGLMGFLAYLFPFVLFFCVAFGISNRGNRVAKRKIISAVSIFIVLCGLLQLIANPQSNLGKVKDAYAECAKTQSGGGLLGSTISTSLYHFVGLIGAYVVVVALLIILSMFITEFYLFTSIGRSSHRHLQEMRERRREEQAYEEDDYDDYEEEEATVLNAREYPKRKAKTFTFQREPRTEQEDDRAEKKGKNKKEEKSSSIIPDFLIQRANPTEASAEVPFEKKEEVYEKELHNKFNRITTTENEDYLSGFDEVVEVEDLHVRDNTPSLFDNVEDVPIINSFTQDTSAKVEEKETADVVYGAFDRPELEPAGKSKPEKKQSADNSPALDIKIETEEPKKEYIFPSINLLSRPKGGAKGVSDRELKETAIKLQSTLESFGVRVTITNVSCGPAVTRYELQPEQGVKVSRITNLADDIKLNLAAADVRIEAPIPGKAAVGIEVPNKVNSTVTFRELIESDEFQTHKSDIAFAVGKDIGGQTVVTDIAKMPHLLIAGATGSGKSVCINTLIMSILYKANPEDVKLIMVDPKVVELSVYNGIPHLLIPVVTDPKKASAALNWAVAEMTDRYKKFADLGVRDIKGYNKKIATVDKNHDNNYQKMPQIVIIIDELADLMMVAPGEVEDAICRLAQMARAAGLHLIIATQRPSVNVITGLIKANIPSRIAFSVSSAIDSRTILDGAGAEKLLGKGDMLFFPSGYPKPVRIQGAFVSDKEVGSVVEFLSSQNENKESNLELESKITSISSDASSSGKESDLDEYFAECGKFIIEKDKASIGMLQRVFKIGFNRAARIMDQLCDAGVVGPEEGTKPRKVLMSMEEFEQYVDEYV